MKRAWKLFMVGFLSLFLILSSATPAFADNKADTALFLQKWADWCTHPLSGYTPGVQFTISSNSGLTNLVSYTTGTLSYHANTGIFEGTGTQYFSDRTWKKPSTGGYLNVNEYPFNPDKTDKVKVEFNKNTGQAIFTLLNWGNTKITFNLRSENQLLYGIGNTGDQNWQSVVISLKKIKFPIVK